MKAMLRDRHPQTLMGLWGDEMLGRGSRGAGDGPAHTPSPRRAVTSPSSPFPCTWGFGGGQGGCRGSVGLSQAG